ncbi:hypothetical protein V8E52_008953 [Russula decolorans]
MPSFFVSSDNSKAGMTLHHHRHLPHLSQFSIPSTTTYPNPAGGKDIYTAIKNFSDASAGIATQCMKASKCFNARPQYYTNIFTCPTSTTPPRNAAGMVVDSDVVNHARSNETSIAFR